MTPGPDEARRRRFMEQALALAALGEGTTSPNPQVGCVLVRGGRVVGSGFHRVAGEPHAEALAVARAGELARGATMYVNLEPCAHHGRTPPCVDRIIHCGVRRVVAATIDPNPRVNGRGFERLRDSGVEVETGLLESEARWINRTFFHWHSTGRPWVTLKAAASLDGLLAARGGRSRWITGPAARRFAHRLRLRHDAVLVGAGTVRRDNPRLTVRLPGIAASRRRVVLSATLELDPGASVFRSEAGPSALIYTGSHGDPTARGRLAQVADVRTLPSDRRGLDLEVMLQDLADQDVRSVLVEGGGRVFGAFLEWRLVNELALFVAPLLIGAQEATPLVHAEAAAEPAGAVRIEVAHRLPLGRDLVWLGRPRFPETPPGAS